MGHSIGIDIGTTHTRVAVCGPASPRPSAPDGRCTDVPSLVFVAADGSTIVGDAALRRGVVEPDRLARNVIRRIADPSPISLGGETFTAAELVGLLAQHVLDAVAVREGGPPDRVAVAHPASWGPRELTLLDDAVAGATTAEVVLVPQPQAVVLGTGGRPEPGSTIAVLDVGGGACDAAVVRCEPGGIVSAGNPESLTSPSGNAFDDLVLDHVRGDVPAALAELDHADAAARVATARLRRECREAKEALSVDDEVVVPMLIASSPGGSPGWPDLVRLTRAEFERWIGPRVDDGVEALCRVIDSAGSDPARLTSVVLVGGSSRTPLFADVATRRLGRPVTSAVDPVSVVAIGAALSLFPDRHDGGRPAGAAAAPSRSTPHPGGAAPATDLPTDILAFDHRADPDGEHAAHVLSPAPDRGRAPAVLIGVGALVAVIAVAGTLVLWGGDRAPSTETTRLPTPPVQSSSAAAGTPPTTDRQRTPARRTTGRPGETGPVRRPPAVPPERPPAPPTPTTTTPTPTPTSTAVPLPPAG